MSRNEARKRSDHYSRLYARAWSKRQFENAEYWLGLAERYDRIARKTGKTEGGENE